MGRFEIKIIEAEMLEAKNIFSRLRSFDDITQYKWRKDAINIAISDSSIPNSDFLRCWFIHPIQLGGDITFDNFSLITANMEKRWNDFIFSQTSGMKIGQKRKILVPFMRGHKVFYDALTNNNLG